MSETVTKKSETQKEAELKKLKAFLMAVIPDSWDKYDYKAKFDSSLTYLENKNRIIEEIRVLSDYKGATLKEQAMQAHAQQDKLLEEENERIAEEVEQYNKTVTFVESHELDTYFAPVDRAIEKLCRGFSHLAFIKGRGGIGKSRRIRYDLTRNKEQFYEVTGDVTEAYLYRLLHENNGKTLWFKDVTKLLRGMNSITLLKAACETEDKRLLTKNNYSKQQNDLPDMFIWKGKIIFDYNEIGPLVLKDDFEALISRGDYVHLAYSELDIHCIMRQISQKPWEKEVTEFLIKSYAGLSMLNLRHQWRAFQTYKYCEEIERDWKSEVLKEVNESMSDEKAKLYSLIGLKAVRTTELIKRLLQTGMLGSAATARRRILDWMAMGDLNRWSGEERNFYVSIRPLPDGIAIPKPDDEVAK